MVNNIISYDCIILDGSDTMYRSFFALPELKSPDGFPTSAITGTLNTIDKIKRLFSGKLIAVFDTGKQNHRHIIHSEYKQHRKSMPDDLKLQWPATIELLKHMGIQVINQHNYEADDIISSIAKQYSDKKLKVLIVSHDKDIIQCINTYVQIYQPTKNILYDQKAVLEKWEITPEQMRDYLAITGDSSDGFKGILGVGDKTAKKWLKEYGSIANIWHHREDIKGKVGENLRNSYEILERNIQLATLIDSIPIAIEEIAKNDDELEILFKRYGMHNRVPKKTPSFGHISDFKSEIPLKNRYWYITEIETNNFATALLHNEKIWFEILDRENLCNLLINSSLSCEDYFWESIFLERLGLQSKVTDISLLLYSEDSGLPLKDLLDAMRNFDSSTPNSKELLSVLKTEQYYAYHVQTLARIHQYTTNTSDYKNIERPLVEVLASMENKGILIDKNALIKSSQEFEIEMQHCQQAIDHAAGRHINLLSPLQLRQWIYNDLKAQTVRKTDQGEWSTAEDALKQLSVEHPILQKILDYRTLSKLNSTYCQGLLKKLDKNNRVHTHYDQKGTITGRLSSFEPNLQNIPNKGKLGSKIRAAFIAKPEYVLISADYSQIELRLIAHLSEDTNMLAALKSGIDIHQQTAAWLLNKDLSDISKEERQFAKTINFGLLYGMSAYGLARELMIDTKEASKIIDNYFDIYKQIAKYRENILIKSKENGFVLTINGRKISLKRNAQNKGWMERLALNAPLQGSASEIIKMAMIAIYREQYDLDLLLQVHDELIFEVRQDKADQYLPFIIEKMTSVAKLLIPLEVTIKQGKNWENMTIVNK